MDKRCMILGCDLEADASYYYGWEICRRCGEEMHYTDPLFYAKPLARFKVYLKIYWRNFVEWCWRKRQLIRCDECGKRFGNHDESVDHIPF